MISYRQSPQLSLLRGNVIPTPQAVQHEVIHCLVTGLQNYYCHLPQKRSAFGFDPIARLRILGLGGEENRLFDRRVLEIITDLRDRHTTIRLPPPWSGMIAYVPFIIEQVSSENRPRYILTKQLFGYEDIPVGVTITHWNGTPINIYISTLSQQTQGASGAARRRLAIADLTLRPLAYVPMPTEDWVQIRYIDNSGVAKVTATPWRFFVQQPNSTMAAGSLGMGATERGVDEQTLIVNEVKKQSIKPQEQDLQQEATFRYGTVETPSGPCAYVRIFSFDVDDAKAFVTRMADILAGLPQERLIIDVRGNPGGLIPAGQLLLRILTKAPLSASTLTFRATEATEQLSRHPMFQAWNTSLALRLQTAETYSQAFSISDYYDDAPAYRYPGKSVLVIDALCYSTTDFFAADFADNKVGPIIGTDATTGGGGANVWSWSTLVQFANQMGLPLRALPAGFDLNISMRRALRTGAFAGIPIEDLAVKADVVHQITERDLLEGNIDLLAAAAALIAA